MPNLVASTETGGDSLTDKLERPPQSNRPFGVVSRLVRGRNWPFWITATVLLVAFEYFGHRVSSLIIVPPTDIVSRAIEMHRSGDLWLNIRVSGLEFILGYGMAVAVGTLVGILIGNFRTPRRALDPIIAALYAMPIIALGPLFIIALGLGIASKVGIVALAAFFPMVMNTTAGVRATDAQHIELGKAFALNESAILKKIVVPSALPYIIAGLRLGVGRGLTAVLGGELFGARAGVGHQILLSASVFDTAGVFVGVAIFAIAGVTLSSALKHLEIRIAPWRDLKD